MRTNLSSAYDVWAEMQYMLESMFMLNFLNVSVAVKNGVMRMMSVMGSSCFCSNKSPRLKNGACFEVGGGALPYLAYTGQVWAAEHKVLSIKQGVAFYY